MSHSGKQSGHIADAALVVGAFWLVDSTSGAAEHDGDQWLDVAWSAAGSLEITQPQRPGIPATPPWAQVMETSRSAQGYRLLAARTRRSRGRALFESIVFQDGDVRGVLTLLSPNEGVAGPSWTELRNQWQAAWERAASGRDLNAVATGRLGDICVFAGTAADESEADSRSGVPPLASQAQEWVAGLELGASGVAWPSAGTVLIGRWQADRRCQLLVLSNPDAAGQLGALVWPGYTNTLSPVMGYLLHAAKLRHVRDRYDSELRGDLNCARRRVEDAVTQLLGTHSTLVDSRSLDVDRLVDTHAQLSRELSEAGGLLEQRTSVQELQLGAQMTVVNMRAYLPAAAEGPVGSLFAQDRSCASALDEQVTFDLTVAALAERRARDAYAMTDLRLRQKAEEQARYQAWLTLLQSSIVGSLLAVLATVTAVKTEISLKGLEEPALVAAVGATAFALPILIAGETRSVALREIALGAMVSAVAWLLAATILNSVGSSLSSAWSLVALMVGPIVVAFGRWQCRRRRAGSSRTDGDG